MRSGDVHHPSQRMARAARPPAHRDRYRGLRWVTVTCSCGWVSQNHRSRGEAHRAFQGHVWLTSRPVRAVYGTNAHRGKQ